MSVTKCGRRNNRGESETNGNGGDTESNLAGFGSDPTGGDERERDDADQEPSLGRTSNYSLGENDDREFDLFERAV